MAKMNITIVSTKRERQHEDRLKTAKPNSLAVKKPELLKEWDWEKNDNLGLDPYQLSAYSTTKAWWVCCPDHGWYAAIKHRVVGNTRCPYCYGHAVLEGFNDLATVNPELAKQWHPTKNGDLTPQMVRVHSPRKVWWICSENHEWCATINSRNNGCGCPYCSGKKTWPGFNDIATTHKYLLDEWDYDNNTKSPTELSYGSHYKASWICGTCGEPYVSSIASRVRGRGCPTCGRERNKKALSTPELGNSLADKNPLLASEWHPTKNGELTPYDVKPCSNKKVWWLCRFGHEWEATVNNRARLHRGCPTCASYMKTSFPEKAILYYVSQKFDDAVGCEIVDIGNALVSLDIWIPSIRTAIEYDGEYWHNDSSRDKSKDTLCFDNNVKLIRVREPGCCDYHNLLSTVLVDRADPVSAQSLDDAITAVLRELGCSNDISVDTLRDKNEILANMIAVQVKNSFGENYPEIAKEWHPTKNGNITPYMVAQHSSYKAWFVCPNGHEYQTAVGDRSYGKGCYKCAMKELGRKKMVPKKNESFADKCPEAAKAWHPTKNGDMTPYDVKPNSNKRFWWKCTECGTEWNGMVNTRTKSGTSLCRACSIAASGKAHRKDPTEFINSVAKNNPTIKVIGEYDGYDNKVKCECKVCGHVWDAWPQNILRGHGCDKCARIQRKETREANRRKKLGDQLAFD